MLVTVMHTLGTINTCSLGSSAELKVDQFNPSFSPVTKQMLRVTHRLAKVKYLLLPRPSGFTEGGSKPCTGCRKERIISPERKERQSIEKKPRDTIARTGNITRCRNTGTF